MSLILFTLSHPTVDTIWSVAMCTWCGVHGCLFSRLSVFTAVCVHGCLCSRLSVFTAVCVHGCLCSRLSVFTAVCVHGCLCSRLSVFTAVCVHGCLSCMSWCYSLAPCALYLPNSFMTSQMSTLPLWGTLTLHSPLSLPLNVCSS